MPNTELPGYKLPGKIDAFRERVIEFCERHVRPRAMEIEGRSRLSR